MVEKWEVAGELEEIGSLPKESFQAIDITHVRVAGEVVSIEFTAPSPSGRSAVTVTKFDFAAEGPEMRTASHPLLPRGNFETRWLDAAGPPLTSLEKERVK